MSAIATYFGNTVYRWLSSVLFESIYERISHVSEDNQGFESRKNYWSFKGLKREYISQGEQYIPTFIGLFGLSIGYSIMLFGWTDEIAIQTRMFNLVIGTALIGAGTVTSHMCNVMPIQQKAQVRAQSIWSSQVGFGLLFVGALLHTGYVFGIGLSELTAIIVGLVVMLPAWYSAEQIVDHIFN
ncbi:hypothetical protein [Natrialba sp. PRR66]|uniref:hypothetical protein n=1 Tax=Natrialba sp. PRR66 TaxID=3098146 RepID=UPI002B1E7B55|nr:hypothetical protein [Natrialba sp. PRR66]